MLVEKMAMEAYRDGIERLVVGAVVHHDRRVLVVRRSDSDDFLPGIEELPSGGVEETETLLHALDRELAEEVGFGVGNPDEGFLSMFDYESRSGRRVRQFTVSVALDSRVVRLSEEHSASRWVSAAEVETTSATSETKRVLSDWFGWAAGALDL